MLQLRLIGSAEEVRALITKLIDVPGAEFEVMTNELPARAPGAVRQYLNVEVDSTGRIDIRIPNRNRRRD